MSIQIALVIEKKRKLQLNLFLQWLYKSRHSIMMLTTGGHGERQPTGISITNEFVQASLINGYYCIFTHNFTELHQESLQHSCIIISNANSQKTLKKTQLNGGLNSLFKWKKWFNINQRNAYFKLPKPGLSTTCTQVMDPLQQNQYEVSFHLLSIQKTEENRRAAFTKVVKLQIGILAIFYRNY